MKKTVEQSKDEMIENIDRNIFTSNTQTVSHESDKFILDFKAVFSQFTSDHKAISVTNHRVILLDANIAKSFLETLRTNIADYEKEFGRIL